ncbi:hypothetical protein OGM63_18290 [Plectonema radiosum NIES-515]|uniref:Uncharacterized protein n=1 Tax=Plectonema radiosum NIES-515 TaxID=2986073 RepID=A0ABT3B2I3_9CYAN|nr:hypothetical protein [Plectonema radiosum]MCV3215440.1 hypothetical protein [Plectonema radiosum NIES-515]
MESINITLPDELSDALNSYMREVSLHLIPAPKVSGFQDTSVNHDKILAEQASQKLR